MIQDLLNKIDENKKIRKMLKKSRYQKLKEKYNTLENEFETYKKESEQKIEILLNDLTEVKVKYLKLKKKMEK